VTGFNELFLPPGSRESEIILGLEPLVSNGYRFAYSIDINVPSFWVMNRSAGAIKKGDNPLYVRVEQEDGHLAWSSPCVWSDEVRVVIS
jgi:hypothetical protein